MTNRGESAWDLIKAGAYRQALPLFEQRCLADPTGPNSTNLGIVHLLLKDYRAALLNFGNATRLTDQHYLSQAHYLYPSICYWCLGKPSVTVDLVRRALSAPYKDAAGGAEVAALMLYVAERLDDAALRREALTQLRRIVLGRPHAWPGPVARFLLRAIDVSQLDQLAEAIPELASRYQGDADFFVALRALREGDDALFRARMRRAGGKNRGFLEHTEYLARFEVEHEFSLPVFDGQIESVRRDAATGPILTSGLLESPNEARTGEARSVMPLTRPWMVDHRPQYFVLFNDAADVATGQILAALSRPACEVWLERSELPDYRHQYIGVRDTDFEDAVAWVYYNDEPSVLDESRAIAEVAAADRPDRDFIAACDRRFEVISEDDPGMEFFNNWLIAAERLADLVGGVMFDARHGIFA